MSDVLLAVAGLSKSFPGLRALDDVSLSIGAGEIVALVGQNGSGKSTLVKTLTGVYRADPGGTFRVRAADGSMKAGAAAESDIHVIHQDLGLVHGLNTIENFDLGQKHGAKTFKWTDRRREAARCHELLEAFGVDFDITVPISELSAAERAIVAIARAMAGWDRANKVLILDEPTTALHGAEVQRLMHAIRQVAASGAAVLFVSHRLDEVMQLADRVVVLRGGRMVADVGAGSFDPADLAEMITGHEVRRSTPTEVERKRETRLVVRGLQGGAVKGIDFDVAAGEIVGLSGLIGSGRDNICGLLFGAATRSIGTAMLDGAAIPAGRPDLAIAMGIGYVPADRRSDGAVMTLSARENLTLPQLRSLRRRRGSIRAGAEIHETAQWADRVQLAPLEPDWPLELFSGGNQQKIVMAKWLRLQPKLLLLDDPTQGVDIGAQAAIHDLIQQAAAQGAAVVLASADEAELSGICNRVLVLRDGYSRAEISGVDLCEAALVLEALRPIADNNPEHYEGGRHD